MEIEKKFLLHSLPIGIDQYDSVEIEQAYISIDPTIRLRMRNNDYFLTVKKNGILAREEAEFVITKEQFNHLWMKIETNIIKKTRFLIPIQNGLTAELDIYYGILQGLMTIEVEFTSIEQANCFVPPEWFGADITDDLKYRNSQLAVNGLTR